MTGRVSRCGVGDGSVGVVAGVVDDEGLDIPWMVARALVVFSWTLQWGGCLFSLGAFHPFGQYGCSRTSGRSFSGPLHSGDNIFRASLWNFSMALYASELPNWL